MSFSPSRLLYAYSLLLIIIAIAALAIIGMKSKNLALTCAAIGIASAAIGRSAEKSNPTFLWLELLLPLAAFLIFTIRANLNFLALIGIVQHELDQYDAYNKCINVIFLIILTIASLTTVLILASFKPRKN